MTRGVEAVIVLGMLAGTAAGSTPGLEVPAENPADRWVRRLKHSSPQEQFQAARELGRLGPVACSAGPALLRAYSHAPSLVLRKEFARSLCLIAAPEAHALVLELVQNNPEGKGKSTALRPELIALGLVAGPICVRLLADPGSRPLVEQHLIRLGPGVVPLVVPLLSSPEADLRTSAARILAQIQPRARGAIPALERTLNDSDPRVDATVLLALLHLRGPDEGLLVLLREALRVPGGIESVLRLLNHLEPTTRSPVLPLLAGALDQAPPETVAQAVKLLATSGEAGLPHLLALFARPEPVLWMAAAQALHDGGHTARGALPTLEAALADPNEFRVLAAVRALLGIDPALADRVVPVLASLLTTSSNPTVIERALSLLGGLGEKARPATGALFHTFQTGDLQQRLQACCQLSRLSPDQARLAVPVVIAGLCHPSEDIRSYACAIAGNLPTAAEELGPFLSARLLAAVDAGLSDQAEELAETLLALHQGQDIVAILGNWVNTLEKQRAIIAMRAIRAMGEVARPALPALRLAAASDRTPIKHLAARTIRSLLNP